MKKLALTLAVISALGLSACDSETIDDVEQEVADSSTAITPIARVVFDPSNSLLSIPNDLLFSGTTDGTLNLPVTDASDFSDPTVAMSALDGWSTTNPFSLAIDVPDGLSLDESSVFNAASVKVYETVMGGDDTIAECAEVTLGLACEVVSELTFGVDYIAQASGDNIVVIPLKPLKGKTTYLVALTDNLKDSTGKSVEASSTYSLVSKDITAEPLATETQLQLQGIINSFESAIDEAGTDADSLIYTFAMTTQSTSDVLFTIKQLLAAPLAAGGTPSVINVADSGVTVAQAFTLQGLTLSDTQTALFSTAQLYSGTVQLPYYLGVPSIENPKAPVTDWWTALCDSGATLAGLAAANPDAIPADALSESDATCMAVSDAAGLTAPGLRDLSSVLELDTERNLTKYNPVPKASGTSDIPWVSDPSILDVQMTTPIISDNTDAVRASFGLEALTEVPAAGWPIVIMQHGITSKKEDMLAMTGVLSAFGFATIAIDHPLHGSRGFDLDGDSIDDINASTVSATHYMNLASLLTTRDNLRQSESDMLGLRLSINAIVGASIDASEVHFLGHSLGAIAGINLVALANTSLDTAIDPYFEIATNSQVVPGVMIAHFLMESGSFGNVIKANLAYSASSDFAAIVDAAYPLDDSGSSTATEEQLVTTYVAFYAALSAEQQVDIDAVFTQFTIAAQTVLESGDPVNYASIVAATETPTHLIEVVGNGVTECEDILTTDNCADQVIPNTVSTSPLSGTESAITLLSLPSVSTTTAGSGAVKFTYGHHSSLLTGEAQEGIAPDGVKTAAATQEMQGQVAGFFASMGQLITITNTDVVE